jgi:hypothetical protein
MLFAPASRAHAGCAAWRDLAGAPDAESAPAVLGARCRSPDRQRDPLSRGTEQRGEFETQPASLAEMDLLDRG